MSAKAMQFSQELANCRTGLTGACCGLLLNSSLPRASKLPWKFLAEKFILKRPGAISGSVCLF